MPIEQTPHGATVITGDAIGGYRCRVAIHAMQLYLAHGIVTTRGATPARLREIASEYTGKRYARSRKGLETALADLQTFCAGKTLDAIGAAKTPVAPDDEPEPAPQDDALYQACQRAEHYGRD